MVDMNTNTTATPTPERITAMIDAYTHPGAPPEHASVAAALKWALGDITADDLHTAIEFEMEHGR